MAKSPQADRHTADNDSEVLDPGSPLFRLCEYPFFRLNRLSSRYASVMDSVLKPLSLDQPRWRVLMILGDQGTCSVSGIADLAIIKLSTLTRIVQRMHRDGLVDVIRRPADNRVTEVSMTAKGETLLVRVKSVASRVFNQAISGIGEDDIRHLNGLVQAMHDNLAQSPYEK